MMPLDLAPGQSDAAAGQMTVAFKSHGRKATCAPNPAFPDGIHVNRLASGVIGCRVELPYPAECCGVWRVECSVCGFVMGVTAAGRPDDVRSIMVPCQVRGTA